MNDGTERIIQRLWMKRQTRRSNAQLHTAPELTVQNQEGGRREREREGGGVGGGVGGGGGREGRET